MHHYGSFTRRAFFVCGCSRQVWCGKLEIFLSVKKCNCMLQPHASNKRRVIQPKAHSHYCVFRVRLRQTVALLRRDRKIPISALTQSTAESAVCCGKCEWALRLDNFFKKNRPRRIWVNFCRQSGVLNQNSSFTALAVLLEFLGHSFWLYF